MKNKSPKKIIIHVGPHKTGTTTLQMFLFKNHGLLESQGFYYPRSGCLYYGHHNLAWELLLDARFIPKLGGWTQLFEELDRLKTQPTVILSSEDFSHMPISSLSLLFQALSGWDITILYVYRSLRDFIVSLHAEEIKNGMTCISLESFAADKIAFDHRMRLGTYLPMLMDPFGVRVIVIPYEKDILPRIHAFLGLPSLVYNSWHQENKKLPIIELQKILAHRREHCQINWVSYYSQYVAPHLAGKSALGDEMASIENFTLSEELVRSLDVQDNKNIEYLESKNLIFSS